MLGVGRSADDVAERLDGRRAVDVGYDDVIRILRFECGERIGRTAIGQRAAGVQIRNDNFLVGVENFGRLGHKMDPGKDDQIGVGFGRLARQSQRVADVIGQVLDDRFLVVVRQDDGVFFLPESVDLRDQIQRRIDGHIDVANLRIQYHRLGHETPGSIVDVSVRFYAGWGDTFRKGSTRAQAAPAPFGGPCRPAPPAPGCAWR